MRIPRCFDKDPILHLLLYCYSDIHKYSEKDLREVQKMSTNINWLCFVIYSATPTYCDVREVG